MRLVVKIGTQSLLTADKVLDLAMIGTIVEQIYTLRQMGVQTVLVSSGAVGSGRALWNKTERSHKIHDSILEKQMLASLGQADLIYNYNKALAHHGMLAAQILLTRHDFRHRRHGVNLGRLLERLIHEKDVLPIINENDSVAVDELVFTDNDELAGLLAPQVGAARLIILSDVEGVYDLSDGQRRVIPAIDFGQGDRQGDHNVNTSALTGGGRGGMASKLATARRMARAGITTHIARAREPDILPRLIRGEALGTVIRASQKPKAIKRWLAAGLPQTRGKIEINNCLKEALATRTRALSILPVGVNKVVSVFEKGDVVEMMGEDGKRLGHGIARYGAAELEVYCGQKQKPVFIHYNALHIE